MGDILLSRNLALMFHMHNIDTVREFRFLPPDSVLHSSIPVVEFMTLTLISDVQDEDVAEGRICRRWGNLPLQC